MALAVGGNEILARWVGPGFSAPLALRLGFGAWTTVAALGMAFAMYLNAANLMRVEVACALVFVPTSIVLRIVMVTRWGIAGIPWAMVLSYVAVVAGPLAALWLRGRLAPATPVAAT